MKCKTCKQEVQEGINCADCGDAVHKECSKKYNQQRYCKKCARKIRKLMSMASNF